MSAKRLRDLLPAPLGAALLAGLSLFGSVGTAHAVYNKPVPAFAMYGEPKEPPDFKYFPYVNPNAPKGGTLHVASIGTYDSFNPFIAAGSPADGLGPLTSDQAPAIPSAVIESLAIENTDEPFAMYGLIAKTIVVPPDRSWVTFNLRKEAHFSDGTPITADDVVFSFNELLAKGAPFIKSYYANVAKVEKNGPLSVTFHFVSANQKELPLILGELPVLSKAFWTTHDLSKGIIVPPLGSGPYKVAKYDIGNYVIYERDPNYWGKDLPINVGRYNFDKIRIDYYRDDIPAFEAFKAGQEDIWFENSAERWAKQYDFPAFKRGDVIRQLIPIHSTQGMEGLFYNTRKPIFQNRVVREALAYAFDFEWVNKYLTFGQYSHARSYFNNSDLEAKGVPTGEELQLLEPFRGKIPDEVFTKQYDPPSTANTTLRDNLRTAQQLLAQAGWKIGKDGKMQDASGKPFKFEILLAYSPGTERIIQPVVDNLKLLGIDATMRPMDRAQFVNRVRSFDFDMVFIGVGESDSPGNEQRAFWGSAAASQPGSRNYAGVHDPAIDAMIKGLVLADTRPDLVAHVHALDRLLEWGYYCIPYFYLPADRIAYWKYVEHPAQTPLLGPGYSTWWMNRSPQGVAPAK
jgi:microcin C transport system substrate-binding protein